MRSDVCSKDNYFYYICAYVFYCYHWSCGGCLPVGLFKITWEQGHTDLYAGELSWLWNVWSIADESDVVWGAETRARACDRTCRQCRWMRPINGVVRPSVGWRATQFHAGWSLKVEPPRRRRYHERTDGDVGLLLTHCALHQRINFALPLHADTAHGGTGRSGGSLRDSRLHFAELCPSCHISTVAATDGRSGDSYEHIQITV